MTTIHTVPCGAKQPSGQFLTLTLQNGTEEGMKLAAPKDEFRRALQETGGVGRFDFQIGDDPTVHHAIARKVEKGSTPDSYRTVVVQEVKDSDVVRMQVLLHVTALPPAAKEHRAQVLQRMRHLVVRGPLVSIPESIQVDLSAMDMNGTLKAGEVPLPEGISLVTPAETEIFNVRELIKP